MFENTLRFGPLEISESMHLSAMKNFQFFSFGKMASWLRNSFRQRKKLQVTTIAPIPESKKRLVIFNVHTFLFDMLHSQTKVFSPELKITWRECVFFYHYYQVHLTTHPSAVFQTQIFSCEKNSLKKVYFFYQRVA